ncbi:MAG: beta-ketoacyl-[acyl-carrier-protein] synthase family protein [Acidobacteriota bacterium]
MSRPPLGPVTVTGLGAVSAWGWRTEDFWRGLLTGAPAIERPSRMDLEGHRTDLASEVPEGGAPAEGSSGSLSRADRFAVAAAVEAWRESGLDRAGIDLGRVGVYFGGSTAAMDEGEEFFRRLVGERQGWPRISWLAAHPLNAPGDAVARALGSAGPVESLSSACASGGLAIGSALEALRAGEVDVAVAGGSDSLCHLTYAGFNSLRAIDAELCRPFRAERSGLNLGEGAGVLILERPDHAAERGARSLGRVAGAGASCDAHHMTAPHPEGEGAARAIRAALEDAGVTARSVSFINAHGTGTPLNDRAESGALREVFGERVASLPVTSTKGVVGHFLGSSGAIEAVATLLCLRHRVVHATPGDGPADPALGVDLVLGEPRSLERASAAVSTSFAFGGSNAAVVLTRESAAA